MESVDHRLIKDLIVEYSDGSAEVEEICIYLLHSNSLTMTAEGAQSNQQQFISNIPPLTVILVDRYASGMVHNEFYHKHFAAISTALAMDKLRFKALFSAARNGDKERSAAIMTRDMIASRFESLVSVIFIHRGYDKAAEFMLKLKSLTRATEAELEHLSTWPR